jgi:putative radical SAM enzyme (TIGR03279 family)
MLGRKKGDDSLGHLKRMTEAGIEVHIQIVLCPGLNDGEVLAKTIDDLAYGYNNIESVGIVPVGLTGHREGLYELSVFSKQDAKALIEEVSAWQRKFEAEQGRAWVYLADEFYISAGEDLPPLEHYDDLPQIENGIGLSRLFIDEARAAMEGLEQQLPAQRLAVVTGTLFAPVLRRVIEELERTHRLNIDVIAVDNLFFGGYVNVTGLLAGSDIVAAVGAWLAEHEHPDLLYLPDVLLNADGLMLDDSKPETVAEKLGLSVKIFESSGTGFISSLAE